MSRSRKTIKAQMEVIVNFLERNRVLVTGKTHPLNQDELERKWVELTEILNGVEKKLKTCKNLKNDILYFLHTVSESSNTHLQMKRNCIFSSWFINKLSQFFNQAKCTIFI